MPNQTIGLRIYGIPRGKGRHQSTVPTDKSGNPYRSKKTGRVVINQYSPKKTKDWEKEIAWQAKKHMPKIPWSGPIRVDREYIMPRTKKLMTGKWAKIDFILHIVKPDIDNLDKALWDSLQGLLFVGDQQICLGLHVKRYTRPGEEPGIIAKFTLLG